LCLFFEYFLMNRYILCFFICFLYSFYLFLTFFCQKSAQQIGSLGTMKKFTTVSAAWVYLQILWTFP